MGQYLYHPDTATYMALDDCVVVDVPDTITESDEIEQYLAKDHPVVKGEFTMDWCPITRDKE